MDVKKYIWDRLDELGLNEYGKAGLMGNIEGESGFKPNNLQDSFNISLKMTDEQYTQAVNNGSYSKDKFIYDKAGYGLIQWTFWSLKKELYEYVIEKRHKSIDDLETQMDLLIIELPKDFKSVLATLRTATSVREASNKVLFELENPNDKGLAQQNKRCAFGEAIYKQYAKGTSSKIVKEEVKLQDAKKLNKSKYRKDFVTTDELNIRYGADKDKYQSMALLPKGTVCHCYGYYNTNKNIDWLLVTATFKGVTYKGYVSSYYLKAK